MPGTNQLADPASFTEWVRERVRYSDTDMQGHVNNLAYMAYAETGRSVLLSTGTVAATLGETPRATFLLARVEVDFLGETRWPGEVDIGTRVERLGRTSVTLGQGIFSAGSCKAVTRSTLVLIDLATRKPTPIEGATREALEAFGDTAVAEFELPQAAMEPMQPMEAMKPMEPMMPMEPMKPMEGMAPMRPAERWWPDDLGSPSTSGGQNDMRYAFFAQARRLAIDTAGTIAVYDTGHHDINGVSQQHGGGLRNLAFSSRDGEVRLETLTKVS